MLIFFTTFDNQPKSKKMNSFLKNKNIVPAIHYAMFAIVGFIMIALVSSLFNLINSYQSVVESGMLNSMSSIEYP